MCERETQEICRVVEYGLDVLNLFCLKSYKIRNIITNFQKQNFKNEVSIILDCGKTSVIFIFHRVIWSFKDWF